MSRRPRARRVQLKLTVPRWLHDTYKAIAAESGLDMSEVGRSVLLYGLEWAQGWAQNAAYRAQNGPHPPRGPFLGPKGDDRQLQMGPKTAYSGPNGPIFPPPLDPPPEEKKERDLSPSLSPSWRDRDPELQKMAAECERFTAALVELLNREAGTALPWPDPDATMAVAARLAGTVKDGGPAASPGDIRETVIGLIGRWDPAYLSIQTIVGPKYWARHAQARGPKPSGTTPAPSPGEARAAEWARRQEPGYYDENWGQESPKEKPKP